MSAAMLTPRLLTELKTATRNAAPGTWKLRALASTAHLSISLLIAAMAFALVYFVWFPREYWLMAGGRELFFLIVSVDVVLGPLITLAIFNPAKGLGRLRFDLAAICFLQLAALCYGLWTVSAARPSYMVYNVDRFSLVTAIALDEKDQALAERAEFKSAPWTGPMLVGSRSAKPDEKLQLVSDALAGKDVELQPKFWVPYAESRDGLTAHIKPLAKLIEKSPEAKRAIVSDALARLQRKPDELGWLPVIARGDWVVLLDLKTQQPLSYLPLDGF